MGYQLEVEQEEKVVVELEQLEGQLVLVVLRHSQDHNLVQVEDPVLHHFLN